MATRREREDQSAAADEDGPAGRLELEGGDVGVGLRAAAVGQLLPMEAVEDEQAEPDADRQAGHRTGGDTDHVKPHEVSEQRDLAEGGEHATRSP